MLGVMLGVRENEILGVIDGVTDGDPSGRVSDIVGVIDGV
mgnify:FL=1|jgi:hypothetical protein